MFLLKHLLWFCRWQSIVVRRNVKQQLNQFDENGVEWNLHNQLKLSVDPNDADACSYLRDDWDEARLSWLSKVKLRRLKMKISLLILTCVVAVCLGSSVPVIKNTRAEGCIDGVCNAHCKYEGNRIFPGDQLNEHGKCRMLKCTSGFDIHITPCPHDGLYLRCTCFWKI